MKYTILLAKSVTDLHFMDYTGGKTRRVERLHPERNQEIPELTRFVAKEALPSGSVFMTMRDELGPVFEDEEFADLYPSIGQPAESSVRLALKDPISQGVRSMGLRRSRYIGLSRTHLQHVATAAAINVVRTVNWLTGEKPEETQVSPFMALSLS